MPTFESKLEREEDMLEWLVSALARGQLPEGLWNKLHEAAARDERLSELAFAYESFAQSRRLKTLAPAVVAELLFKAGTFFGDVFGDELGAVSYFERALAALPTHGGAFDKLDVLLTKASDWKRLAEMYVAQSTHRPRAEQLALLRRAAELVEMGEQMGVPGEERAAEIYAQLLRLDPGDTKAREALEEKYLRANRHRDVARLLEQALTSDPPPDDAQAMKMRGRLLELYATQLHEPERTMPHVEAILAREPANEGARAVAVKLLAIKGLAARAAAALADAHEATGDSAEVAKYLLAELESTRGPKRLTVLTRLGKLRQDRLNDPQGAYEAFEQALALDPSEDDLRVRYVTLSLKLGKALEAARTLSRVGTVAKEAHVRARLSAEMGELLAAGGDTRRARATFVSVLSTASADPVAVLKAARALAEIYATEKDAKALCDVLDRIAEVEPDAERRRRANEQLAEVAGAELGDTARAIAAWRKLVDTSSRGRALAALEPLYEAAGDNASLAFVLEERSKDAHEARNLDLARSLAFRAAEVLTQAGDAQAAAAAWKRVVEKYGAARDVHAQWLPILEAQRQWPELAQALSAEAQLAPESERAAVYARLGHVRWQRTREVDAAIDAFRRALAIDAGEKTSRAALEKLLTSGEHRLAAAAVLEPIYRAEDATAGLLRVLDLKAQLGESSRDRLDALEEAMAVAAASAQEKGRALDFAGRGLAEAVADGGAFGSWLSRVEKLSAASDPKRLAALLGKALGDRAITSSDLMELAKRTGEALAKSGDVAAALEVYRRALTFEPSSAELIGRVDDLLRDQGSPEERVALYHAALARGVDPARRRELLHAIAGIERNDLKNAAAAIEAYRAALRDDEMDRDAHVGLVELLTETGATRELCEQLEHRLARVSGEEAAAVRAQLADRYAAEGDHDRARVHAAALLDEKALGATELDVVSRVADALGDVALARAVLERRAADGSEPREQMGWLVKLGALEHERAGDDAAAASAWKRAAALGESVGEDGAARELYERVRAIAPRDHEAVARLAALLERAGEWARLPDLYDVLVDAEDDEAAAATLLRAARTHAEKLGDAPAAMAAAARAFGRAPGDREVLGAFERYALAAAAPRRFAHAIEDALSNGVGRLGDDAALRADLGLARARALGSDVATHEEAIVAYRMLLETGALDDARTRTALGGLEALLEASGEAARAEDWRWLLAWRVEHAPSGDQAPALLAFAMAEETRFGDAARALARFRELLAIEPDHAEAMAGVARLALALGEVDEALAALRARRNASEGAARNALDLEMATILLERTSRVGDALGSVASVLESAPNDATALALSARLLALPETRNATMALLEKTLESVEDEGARAQVLTRLLDTPADAAARDLRRGWYERLLDLESAQGKTELALATVVRAADEMPGVEALWDRAEELARDLHRPDEVAALYGKALERPMPREEALALGQRAVAFHEEWYEDSDRVVRILERILEIDPTATWAFDRLKLLFDAASRWDDLFGLFDRALASATNERKIELLEDAAQIAKDFANRSERAIGYLEQLLALRPQNARLSASLERLYERHGRHRELVALLGARVAQLPAKEAQGTRARIAGLWLTELGDAPAALAMVEEMLTHPEAGLDDVSGLLERILSAAPQGEARDARESVAPPPDSSGDRASRPSVAPMPKRMLVRQRAAALLKERYVEAGRDADLVRVLEVELEAVKNVKERIRRHTQIAELYAALGNDAQAVEHYVALVLLEPDVAAHRAKLAELAARIGRQDRLAEVLVAAADDCADEALRVDLLMQAGAVHEEALAEPARAIDLFFRVIALPAGNAAHLPALRRLDALLAAAGRLSERLDVLEQMGAIDPDHEARRGALGAAAALATSLGESERAIAAWNARLEADGEDEEALSGLVERLGAERRWRPLLDVLARRAAVARLPEETRRGDRVQIAEILQRELGATDDAIAAWQEVERAFGESAESTAALRALLEGSGRFDEVASLLERSAQAAASGEERASLLAELGDVQRGRLGDAPAAIASYRASLESDRKNERARAGLDALLAMPAQAPAAIAVLLETFAATDAWQSTLGLTEHRIAAAEDAAAKVRVLLEAARTAEDRANDLAAAFDFTRRALLLAPENEAIAEDARRLAAATGEWRALATAIDAALTAADARGDGDVEWAARLRFTLGEVLEERLDDAAAALPSYLQVARAAAAQAKGDERAVHAVVRVAGRVLRWDAAAPAIVQHVAARGAVAPELLAAIEAAASTPAGWDGVTGALAAAIGETRDLPASLARDLETAIAVWHRDRRGDPDAAELSFARALAHAPSDAGLLSDLASLQRRAKGRPLVESLVRLSEATGGDLDLLREAAEVASGAVGDHALAKGILERLVALATERWTGEGESDGDGEVSSGMPASPSAYVEWGVVELVRILDDEGDAEAIVDRLEATARLPFAAERARAFRHEAARVARDRAKNVDRAVALFTALTLDDERDTEATNALVELLEANGLHRELLAVRTRQVGQQEDRASRVELRLEVARLEALLGDEAASIATLRANLDEEPRDVATVLALVERFERRGAYDALAALLAQQAAREEASGEAAAAADLWARAAMVAEERLGDRAAAMAHHERVTALEPRASSLDALARLHAARGAWGAAAEQLDRLRTVAPATERGAIALRLAEALENAGRPDDARRRLEEAFAASPDAAAIGDRLAATYRKTEEWSALADLLTRSSAHAPDKATRLSRLREAADLHRAKCGAPEAAIPLLEQASDLDPEDRTIRLALADAFGAATRYAEARSILRGLVEGFGGRRPKERAPVHYHLARLDLAMGDRAQALVELDAATRIDPANPEILRALGELAREDGQLERAERSYRALLAVLRRVEPTPSDAPIVRSEVLLELSAIAGLQGEKDRAAELLESALETASKSDVETARLEAALRARGDFETLARALEARIARSTDPEAKAAALIALATVLEENLGQLAAAFDARLRAVALAPRSPSAHAAALSLAKRMDAVPAYVAHLEGLARAAGESSDTASELALRIGAMLEEAGDDTGAARHYEQAQRFEARLPEVLRALDRVYERMGDLEAQERVLAQRLEIESMSSAAQSTTDGIYRLASLKLRRDATLAEGCDLLVAALGVAPDWDRAEAALAAAVSQFPREGRLVSLYERVGRAPGHERALVKALTLRWEQAGSGPEPLREAVDVARGLGDDALAESLLRRFVERASEPASDASSAAADRTWALTALADLRVAAGDVAGAVALKEQAAEGAEPADARRLRFEVARLAADRLGDLALAARTYEALHEREPADREAWEPLLDVYRRLGRHDALATLLGRVVEYVDDDAERSRLRLERVRVTMDELGLGDDAAPLLREIVDEDPTQVEAAMALAGILERTGKDDELAELLARQLDAAKDRDDAASVVSISLRLGALLEKRSGDDARAVYAAALDWDPKSRDVLRGLLRVHEDDFDPSDRADVMEKLLAIEEGDLAERLALELSALRATVNDDAGAQRALEIGYRAVPQSTTLRDKLEIAYRDREAWNELAELYVLDANAKSENAAAVSRLREAATVLRVKAKAPAKAAAVLRQARARAKENTRLLSDLVTTLIEADDKAGAALELTLAIDWLGEEHPHAGPLHSERAALRRELGDDEGARVDLEQAVAAGGALHVPALVAHLEHMAARATESDDDATARTVRLRLVELHTQAGAVQDARAMLAELLKTDAKDREALHRLARLEEAAENWDAASATYRRLVALEEGEAIVTTALRLADACERAGRLEGARGGLERARMTAPENEALTTRLEQLYEATGATRELAELHLEAARRERDVARRFASLVKAGTLLLQHGSDPNSAVGPLREANALRPGDLECTARLSEALASAGRAAEAMDLLAGILAAHKGRRSRELAAIHLASARVARSLGDRNGEVQWLTSTLDMDPQNGVVASELALAARELGQLEIATRALRTVTMLKVPAPLPRAVAYQYLGEIARQQGDAKRAVMLLKRALDDDPSLDAARSLLTELKPD